MEAVSCRAKSIFNSYVPIYAILTKPNLSINALSIDLSIIIILIISGSLSWAHGKKNDSDPTWEIGGWCF